MAVNCLSVPRNTCEFAGVTAIETRTASVTVNVLLLLTPDFVALTVDEPVERLVPKPEPEIVTTFALEEDQATEAVISCVDPSRKWPVAVSCWFSPKGTEGADGVISIDFRFPPRPGAKLPAPQPLSRLRHNKAAQTACAFTRSFHPFNPEDLSISNKGRESLRAAEG